MTIIHNLGFPRVGARRELKFAQESFWKGESSAEQLQDVAKALRARHWGNQAGFDFIPVGDFTLYDHMLDMSVTLGNLPKRAFEGGGSELDAFFRTARGRSPIDKGEGVPASDMTKWFNSNYHYIVPEFDASTTFTLNSKRLLSQIEEAKALGVKFKPVIVGPVTYLRLGKSKDETNRLDLLEKLLPVYKQLLNELATAGAEWVQIDEPALATTLCQNWRQAFKTAYHELNRTTPKLLLTTYFGDFGDNLDLIHDLPVDGIHLDTINAQHEVNKLVDLLPTTKVLSLGIIDGRNIWKSDLNKILDWIEPIKARLGDRLWLAPSSSLLHVPVDLEQEDKLDAEIKNWLAFAIQKLDELRIIKKALDNGRNAVSVELQANKEALQSRANSPRVHNPEVKARVKGATPEMANRKDPYEVRVKEQQALLKLPAFPTTTIGSFPQTAIIRKSRSDFKAGNITEAQYIEDMKADIRMCVEVQEALDIDVFVHGEAERNDMVEYFGEQLQGYVFSRFGWVQSYGSRCVKPPIIFGDISRPNPMTVFWSQYAQSLTKRPMKAMLTGPVTILNWSFVRDDQPRSETCLQIAFAIRDEVLDLEKAGLKVIQIDEPALREGLPLKKSDWQKYLDWAVFAFRVSANGVLNDTQIHTHMCYSEFNDIMQSIADLDADVITIETSRSDMELLDAFENFNYPNEIGPGVYDIHSPNVPSVESMVHLMEKALKRIPKERLWVNPDCGLKTRGWTETKAALENMVKASKILREKY